MINKLAKIGELKKFFDYKWTEIDIGCSDTKVYRLTNGQETLFLKAGKSGMLTNEFDNLKKLKRYLNVPEVIFHYDNDVEILVTTAMSGQMSCRNEFIHESPEETVDYLCDAIKAIQSVSAGDDLRKEFKVFDIKEEVQDIKKKFLAGEIKEIPNKSVFDRFSSLNEVISYLEINQPEGEFCLSHGDVSMPNVFIDKGGFVGFIDVGNAGIRQKWYDVADLYISIRRNFQSQEIADKFLVKLNIQNKSPVEYYEILTYLS